MPYNKPYFSSDEIESSIETYVKAVRATLDHWLKIHTDREAWVENWLGGCDVRYIYDSSNGELSNNYFTFGWANATKKYHAENTADEYTRCDQCGAIGYIGDEEYICECEDADFEEPSAGDVLEHIDMNEASYYSDDELLKSLVNDGFDCYSDALDVVISGIVDEVTEIIESIDSAEDSQSLLVAVLYGTRVYHVHGNIFSNYGGDIGLEPDFIDNIRNNGLNSVYSNEEIAEFINK